MSAVADIIRSGQREECQPWPRFLLTRVAWRALADALAAESSPALIGLWAEPARIHGLFVDERARAVLPVATWVADDTYPALSPGRPLAAWFERAVRDLWGYEATGGVDARPWLDHGRWRGARPMSPLPPPTSGRPEPPEFLPVEADGRHDVALGPVHGGVAEPGHFRFRALGETVLRLETRLGYTHKGHLALMRGKPSRVAARFAARISGDSTVAHSVAFARAVEAATQTEAPPRAQALRGVMAEMERIANHLGDLGASCNAAGYAAARADCGGLRETLLRMSALAFGHRLMMDCVVPGGVAADMSPEGSAHLTRTLAGVADALPRLLRDYVEAPGLADRATGTGRTDPAWVAAFAPGGVVGRAAGRAFDARLWPGYAPYGATPFTSPVRTEGDVDARVRVRFAEIADSLRLIEAALATMPQEGEILVALPSASGEGIGVAEGFRGDIWHWVRLEAGLIAASFPRDPSWAHWPLLERSVCDDTVREFPLCHRSVNPSISGVDL